VPRRLNLNLESFCAWSECLSGIEIFVVSFLDVRVTDRRLTQLASNGGFPDWVDEGLEEKGRKLDFIRVQQYARAILFYRSDAEFRVAWRYTSTRRKVFADVFDFYDFLQEFAKGKK
jgi:hypothetical protein